MLSRSGGRTCQGRKQGSQHKSAARQTSIGTSISPERCSRLWNHRQFLKAPASDSRNCYPAGDKIRPSDASRLLLSAFSLALWLTVRRPTYSASENSFLPAERRSANKRQEDGLLTGLRQV